MSTPITIQIPHQLGRAEARKRIENGFASVVQQVPGGGNCTQQWDGDRLRFSVATMGQTVAGTVLVEDTNLTFEVQLPGMLGMLAGSLSGRLRKAGQLLLTRK